MMKQKGLTTWELSDFLGINHSLLNVMFLQLAHFFSSPPLSCWIVWEIWDASYCQACKIGLFFSQVFNKIVDNLWINCLTISLKACHPPCDLLFIKDHLFALIYICKCCTCITFMHGHVCLRSFGLFFAPNLQHLKRFKTITHLPCEKVAVLKPPHFCLQ